MTDLAAQSPVEIDTQLAEIYARIRPMQQRRLHLLDLADKYDERGNREAADAAESEASALLDAIDALNKQALPLEEQYQLREWERYYLVTNTNGHVHDTMRCDTCFSDTSFAWLTQFSGTSREDLVELAGEKACTVCFPDAPVEVRNRPSKLTTPEREARQAEKAAKAAEKVKSEVVVEDYRDGYAKGRRHVFKTVRGATNQVASLLSSMVGYGPTHPTFEAWQHDVSAILDALVAKGEISDKDAYYNEALAKARKKCVAEHKKFMASPAAASYRAQGILDPAADEPDYTPVKF
jgi:polyhydroxyalkanoate synthesis regulator phasin